MLKLIIALLVFLHPIENTEVNINHDVMFEDAYQYGLIIEC